MSRKTKYQLALAHKTKSQQYLDQYVQDIARRKGFTEDQVLKFGACWTSGAERSEISPDYARNFICDFILGKVQSNTQLSLF